MVQLIAKNDLLERLFGRKQTCRMKEILLFGGQRSIERPVEVAVEDCPMY